MSRITDYGFLFQTTFGTSKTNLVNNIQLSQMNSSSVQKQLKAAGIDTNSKKYKAALSEMMKNGTITINDFNGFDPSGKWKIWIVTKGTVSTSTETIKVYYTY